MQSSIAVAGRALLMLACVVGIPAVALSGTSWSEMVKKLQDFHWSALLDFASTATNLASSDTPRLATSSLPSPSTPQSAATVYPYPTTPPAAQAAAPVNSQSSVVPAGFQMPVDAHPVASSIVPATGETTAAAVPPSDSFHAIQARLRQLGATYYLLESWGTEERLFRFYCKVAIGGSPDYTRYFESTHGDPLQAMSDVLRQVERWQQGGTAKSGPESVQAPQTASLMPLANSQMPNW